MDLTEKIMYGRIKTTMSRSKRMISHVRYKTGNASVGENMAMAKVSERIHLPPSEPNY
jgi:hypothetical protein